MKDESRVRDLLAELDALDSHLDPRPARRGALIADLVTVLVIVALSVVLDLRLMYPGLLVLLLFGGRRLTRFLRARRDQAHHLERERLLQTLEEPRSRNLEGGSG